MSAPLPEYSFAALVAEAPELAEQIADIIAAFDASEGHLNDKLRERIDNARALLRRVQKAN